jgi:hypothetical protein
MKPTLHNLLTRYVAYSNFLRVPYPLCAFSRKGGLLPSSASAFSSLGLHREELIQCAR